MRRNVLKYKKKNTGSPAVNLLVTDRRNKIIQGISIKCSDKISSETELTLRESNERIFGLTTRFQQFFFKNIGIPSQG